MTRPVVRLPERLRQEIVDHCLAGRPNEACGLLAVDGDAIVRVYPTGNLDESPTSFTIPPDQHFAALQDAEAEGWTLGGVFHSHPRGHARPSMTDAERALEPEWVYLVVGLSGKPDVRGWSIRDGRVDEVSLG